MAIVGVKIHAVDADEPVPPPQPPDPMAALRVELNALKARVKAGAGGAAARGAKPSGIPPAIQAAPSVHKCAHCTSDKHVTEDCWYLYIPLVVGKLVIPPEDRARVCVAHGLPAVFIRSATPKI